MVEFENTAGPMTRTVRDAALLLDVIVAYDPADPYTAVAVGNRPEGSYASGLREDALEGAQIGVLRDTYGADFDPDRRAVNEVIDRSLRELASTGAEVIDPVENRDREEFIVATTLYEQQCKHDFNAFFQSMKETPCAFLR